MNEILLAVIVITIVCILDVSAFTLDKETTDLLYNERKEQNTDMDTMQTDTPQENTQCNDLSADLAKDALEKTVLSDTDVDISFMTDEFIDDVYREMGGKNAKYK